MTREPWLLLPMAGTELLLHSGPGGRPSFSPRMGYSYQYSIQLWASLISLLWCRQSNNPPSCKPALERKGLKCFMRIYIWIGRENTTKPHALITWTQSSSTHGTMWFRICVSSQSLSPHFTCGIEASQTSLHSQYIFLSHKDFEKQNHAKVVIS